MKKKLRISLGLAAALAFCAPAQVQAHAMLERAEPRVGNSVPTAPREIRLIFSQALEGAFTTVSISDPAGRPVSGKPRVSGTTVTVPMTASGPGTYRVKWKVLSKDSHMTEGNYTFVVGP